MEYPQYIIDRFWSKVDKPNQNGCREWIAGLHGLGPRNRYGAYWDGTKMIKAHRFAWIVTNGDIPEEKLVLHKCDNKICCNTEHLYIGTEGDNIGDRESRNPVDRAICGVTHTKLYEHEVLEIRKLKGEVPQNKVATMYCVSKNIIYRIWNRDKFLCKEGHYA
jgi:hypothetical protein